MIFFFIFKTSEDVSKQQNQPAETDKSSTDGSSQEHLNFF